MKKIIVNSNSIIKKIIKAIVIALVLVFVATILIYQYFINNNCTAILIFKRWDKAEKCHERVIKYKNPEEMFTFFNIFSEYYKQNKSVTKLEREWAYDYLYFANKYTNGRYLEKLKEFEKTLTKEQKIAICNQLISDYAMLSKESLAREVDYKKAFNYATKSSYLGSSRDQESLAVDYATGNFFEKNILDKNNKESYKWFYISYKNGNERALKGMKKLTKEMTKKDIDESRDSAEKFLKDFKDGKIEVNLYE